MDVLRLTMAGLSKERFQKDFVSANQPLIIENVFGEPAQVNTQWSLAATVALLDTMPLKMRCYGKGHIQSPQTWSAAGYCQREQLITALQYAQLIENGHAQENDFYVVCDAAPTRLGQIFQAVLNTFSQKLGLELSNFGPTVNIWWGAPGHTEALHCDITDGTLWQLSGKKKVTLFPDYCWKQLAAFPFGDKMSWAFSQINLDAPDFNKFPQLSDIWDKKISFILSPGEVLYIPAIWAHHITGISGEHVLSINRFWRTPMSKMRHLPDDVLSGLNIGLGKV